MIAHLTATLTLRTVGEMLQQHIEAHTVHTHGIDDTGIHTEVSLRTSSEHKAAIGLSTQCLQRIILGFLNLALLILRLTIYVFRLRATIQELLNSWWRVRQATTRHLITKTDITVTCQVCPSTEFTNSTASYLEVNQCERTTLVPVGLTDIQMPLRLLVLLHRHLEVQGHIQFAGTEGTRRFL